VTQAMPPFRKIFNGICPNCPWEHACHINRVGAMPRRVICAQTSHRHAKVKTSYLPVWSLRSLGGYNKGHDSTIVNRQTSQRFCKDDCSARSSIALFFDFQGCHDDRMPATFSEHCGPTRVHGHEYRVREARPRLTGSEVEDKMTFIVLNPCSATTEVRYLFLQQTAVRCLQAYER